MALDIVDVKYFKMAVGTHLRKEGINDLACDCPNCDDTKGRLHLYINDGMDQSLAHCFNAGCDLEEQHMGMVNFLKTVAPNLVPQYKREKFKDIIQDLKDKDKPSLNDILSGVKKKSEPIPEPEEPVTVTPVTVPKVKKELIVPEIFKETLVTFNESPEAVAYMKSRGIEPEEDWLFSYNRFVNFFEKPYFVENYFFIPLWQNNKLGGFYTRSITEKRFSTIIFPKREKYYAVKDLNYDEPCYIFEGIIDAMSSGLDNTAAMLSADLPDEFLEELKEPIFCFDNDETGVHKALKYNKMGHKTFVWPDVPFKDMNEILQKGGKKEENKLMITENIFSGIPGQIRLNLSKA